jgi:hypothetical protein
MRVFISSRDGYIGRAAARAFRESLGAGDDGCVILGSAAAEVSVAPRVIQRVAIAP